MTEMQQTVVLEDEQIAQMRVADLKEKLRRRGLRIYGRKRELIARLQAMNAIQRKYAAREGDVGIEIADDDKCEDDVDDECGNIEESTDLRTPEPRPHDEHVVCRIDQHVVKHDPTSIDRLDDSVWHRSPHITFCDVEDSVEKFSGDDHVKINGWISRFEE